MESFVFSVPGLILSFSLQFSLHILNVTQNIHARAYRMFHEMYAKLRVVIHWLILSEKCYINMDRNLNRCVVVTK
jgi:hypothetical protein